MKIAEVANLSPIERFLYWIRERHAIYLRRKLGRPKPWTDDEILQSYRFCNVRRMDDKVSVWLLENWYKPNYNHSNMALAVVIARHFNRPVSLKACGFPFEWRPEDCISNINALKRDGVSVFNGAYMIRASGEYPDKVVMVIKETAQAFVDRPLEINHTSMGITHKAVEAYRNLGSFMAGQVVADLRWAIEGTWEDKDSWAPMGPGSARGLNRLLDKPLNSSWKQADFQLGLKAIIEICLSDLDPTLTSRLEAMDYQNCLCEYDKYDRTLLEGRRPKAVYPGAK